MRRPAGLVSGPSARVGVVQPQPRNLVQASLAPAGQGCDCGGARSRRSAQPGDKVRLGSYVVAENLKLSFRLKGIRRLHSLIKRQRRRRPRSRGKVKAKTSKKQDHCMADVKMNCFR